VRAHGAIHERPGHRISRFDFATDGKRLFLNFAADESDVHVVELDP
jgi:hypothetical protein